MIVTLLPACSSKEDKKDTEQSTTTTTDSSSGKTGDAVSEEKKVLPYDGKEITISMLGWTSYKDLVPGSKFEEWFKEQIGNIKLDIEIPAADDTAMYQKCDLYLASGDMPDLMVYRGPDKFIRNYGDGSVTLNLLDYAEYMPQYMERRRTYPHLSWYDKNGACYLFFPCWYDATSEVWYQNDDLMTKYNLKTPTNYDEMIQCIDTVIKAEPDKIGMLFYTWGFEYQMMCFSSLFGSAGRSPCNIYYDYDKNKWVFSLFEYEDIFYNATKAMADAYAKGYLPKDFINMQGDVWTNHRNNGDWLFAFLYNNITIDEYNNTYKAKLKYIDPPAANGVTPSVRCDYGSDITGWGYVVSKKTKYPEICAALLELIGSKEMAEAYYWGWEGETYRVSNGKKEFIPEFQSLPKEETEKKYAISPYPYVFFPLFSNFYASDALMASFCDESRKGAEIAAQKLKSGEYEFYYGALTPDFSDDVNEKLANLTNAVRTYINETLTAFVLGNKPLSEWDSFVAGVKDYGDIDWALEQHNNAEQKPLRALQKDRNYITP